MDNFMNPQKLHKGLQEPDKPWSFIESALIARHAPEVGPHPMKMKCPSCAKQITSHIDTETYSKTHFCAAALIMTIVCCPLSCLVYLIDTWKRKHHYCPECKMYLGTYSG
ncbi:unnamed protein product [Chironomus riparius]|uniref:LITAF domain-containing protein n=1 Tax=Chironomus riparius TaxID=315576 RepID=A0A9N9WKC6_9DIPT|nr:unnamed protein product [Chironomus riparius]